MFDDLDFFESFGLGVLLFIALFGGLFVGVQIAEPTEMKDNNCIIYDHEMYCKENIDENKEISNN